MQGCNSESYNSWDSIILKMCFKLKLFQMLCSGIEQIACNSLGFWICFFNCCVHN